MNISVGGGFFTGRYFSSGDEVEAGSRFDPNRGQGQVNNDLLSAHSQFVECFLQNYRKRYWNEPYFKAVAAIKELADKHNLTMPEIGKHSVPVIGSPDISPSIYRSSQLYAGSLITVS
jgi:hypothetical protein